jgi:hypothetical protein
MPCVLRIGGAELDPEAFTVTVALSVYRVDRKGQPRALRSQGPFERSMVHVDVSTAGFDDLAGQVADAMKFLTEHADAVRAALSLPGVDRAVLDFGVAGLDGGVRSHLLPAELVAIAGALGLGLEISTYPE